MRVLLVKPYQEVPGPIAQPPLGLLYLAAAVRACFGSAADVQLIDMKSRALPPDWLAGPLRAYRPDVVGVSALNCESSAARRLASLAKAIDPDVVTVLGGPFAHRRAAELLRTTPFDWIFDGGSERTFPEALSRHFTGRALGEDIPGLSYVRPDGRPFVSPSTDPVRDLDELPFPAWDLVDFDFYARLPNMMAALKGRRYAPLFTSRGCPYRCNYCHDLFGKRFVHRSAENVLAEIELLYGRYGVDEFEIVDDIFNLHKPRLKHIMAEVARRWCGRIHFCFPNGVRADIIDDAVLDALHAGGTYAMSVAIESVTPRLQVLMDKHLDVDRAARVIDAADARGMMVCGFFMLGFPTETEAELRATIDFALRSRLSTANFFTVIPQPQTPLYELARKEGSAALAAAARDEVEGASYQNARTWYERAYGFPLSRFRRWAYVRFYFAPRRIWRILRRVPRAWIVRGLRQVLANVLRRAGRVRTAPYLREQPPARFPTALSRGAARGPRQAAHRAPTIARSDRPSCTKP